MGIEGHRRTVAVVYFGVPNGWGTSSRAWAVIGLAMITRDAVDANFNCRRVPKVGNVEVVWTDLKGSKLWDHGWAAQSSSNSVFKRVIRDDMLMETRDNEGHGLTDQSGRNFNLPS